VDFWKESIFYKITNNSHRVNVDQKRILKTDAPHILNAIILFTRRIKFPSWEGVGGGLFDKSK